MDLELRGKTVLVTGAGRGIGLAICERFVAEGSRVVANARTQSPRLADLLGDGTGTIVLGDIRDEATVEALVRAADGAIDVLVNNAGVAPARPDGFLAIDDDDWQATFALDLFAPLRMIRAVLPAMLAAGGGCVVTIGSLNARLPDPVVLDYSAAKASLANATKSLSKEYGRHGVRLNSVDPGPVATDLWNGVDGVARMIGRATGTTADSVAASAAEAMATGRFSTPTEVATIVAMLASPLLSNVTGASFVIDGGMQPAL